MELINVLDKRKIEFRIASLRILKTTTEKGKYPETNIDVFDLTAEQEATILNMVVANLQDLVAVENFNDWLEPSYKFRVVINKSVVTDIIDKYPDFYAATRKGTINPSFTFGDVKEIYFNSFMAGACDVLELEYKLTIESQNKTDNPRNFVTEILYPELFA